MALNHVEDERERSAQTPLRSDQFTCRICLDCFSEAERAVLEGCNRDLHSCCSGCLGHHLSIKILEGKIDHVRCPCFGEDGCAAIAQEHEIAGFAGEAVAAKYRRFRLLHDQPDIRECPQCEHPCQPERHHGRIVMDMRCPECHCQFCHAHSTAHAPGRNACTQYVRDEATVHVNGNFQPCPGCGILTARVQGCVRLHCQCGTDWCWACGHKIEMVGWHYNPTNPSACRLDGSRPSFENRCLKITCWVWSLPMMLVCSIIVAAFVVINYSLRAVLFIVFLPFFLWCGNAYKNVANSCTFAYAGMLFQLLLPICWGIVSLPMYGLLLCFGAKPMHFKYMCNIPVRFLHMLMELLLFQGAPPDPENNGMVAA